MQFVLQSGDDNYIPPNCTSILLEDPSKFIFLCNYLRGNTTIQRVHLYGIDFGDEGAKEIAKVLKVNRTITGLSSRSNLIGVEGAKAIADALKVNYIITLLDLSCKFDWNEIGDEGVKAIVEALKVNCTITILHLCFSLYVFGYKERDAIKATTSKINTCVANDLQQAIADMQCKTMALGLLQKVPIYLLLDIHELVVILNLEQKTDSHKFYNNHLFLKLFESKVSKKRLLRMMDKMNRQL